MTNNSELILSRFVNRLKICEQNFPREIFHELYVVSFSRG